MATLDISPLSNRRQITLVAAGVLAVAVLLFAIWYWALRVPYLPTFTELKSSDAATIVAELDRLKTPYRVADGGATILLPEDRVDATRVSILGGDLPIKGAVGFELFNKTDMGLSEFAQKINYQRALQGELARTIMALEGVDTARVHLSLPEGGLFNRDRQIPKASITIAMKMRRVVDIDIVNGIQQLVASAVPDLQAANVAILDANGRLLSAIASTLPTNSNNGRSPIEQSYIDRIRTAMASNGLMMPMTIDVRMFGGSSGNLSANTMGSTTEPRKTPLRVSVSLTGEPGTTVRERLQATARQAVGFDGLIGDIVVVEVVPVPVSGPQAQPASRPSVSVIPPPLPTGPPSFFWLAAAILVALCVGFVGLFGWRAWHRQTLSSPNDRDAFAARLRDLLDEDARRANVAS
jgi:flagellar M-ring protein FliF